MVGRIGKESRNEQEAQYPDSIQSILSIIDRKGEEEDGASYDSHKVLPFLDVVDRNDIK